MNRYQKTFSYLYQNKIGAFVPFITLGDPNPVTCMQIIDTLISSGSDALELGIPFSDPVSDGISIQKSIQRAFKSNTNFSRSWELIKIIRSKYPNIPIGLLVYANLIFKKGINNFYSLCEKFDVDSVLIPDVPMEENAPFKYAATNHNIAHISICPPNATKKLIENIIKQKNGYIYLLSRPGVTGYSKNATIKLTVNITVIQHIKQKQNEKLFLPILQGFGIYNPEQAKKSLLSGTSGVIVGSLIADIIENNLIDTKTLLKKLKKLVYSMKTSMHIHI